MKRSRSPGATCLSNSPEELLKSFRDLEKRARSLARKLQLANRELQNTRAEKGQLEDALNRVNTLAALGQMAATVAHEIRNPLGGIAGFAGLLERDLPVDDSRRKWVKKILEGVSSLNIIVTGLLNYTRPGRLNVYHIDMVDLIEESASFIEIDLARREAMNIHIERAYDVSNATCVVDPEQMQQVFLNLLQNAVQAMPDGGRIIVGVRTTETGAEREPLTDAGPASRAWIDDEDWVEVFVTDSGVGIPEDIRKQLFTPFFTTKENGTGLGLATAQKIVQAHRGVIRVDSEVGNGTRFTVALPKCAQDKPQHAPLT